METERKWLCRLLMCCVFACCLAGCGTEAEYEDTTNPVEGLSMTVCEDTVTGIGLAVKFKNGTGRIYGYGMQFTIEKKKGRGWVPVKPIGTLAVDDWLRSVEPGRTETYEYIWAGYYGALAKGEYRILADMYAADSDEEVTLSAEFTIF